MTDSIHNSDYSLTAPVGVIFGKFYPFHQGHHLLISRGLQQTTDKLIVFVCSSLQRDLGLFLDSSLIYFPTPADRISWIAQEFANEIATGKLELVHLQEDNIPSYPNGWQLWSDAVIAKLKQLQLQPQLVFTSEPQDMQHYQDYLGLQPILVDYLRETVHISGTECRRKLLSNYHYLCSATQKATAIKFNCNTQDAQQAFVQVNLAQEFNGSPSLIVNTTSTNHECCNHTSMVSYAPNKLVLPTDKQFNINLQVVTNPIGNNYSDAPSNKICPDDLSWQQLVANLEQQLMLLTTQPEKQLRLLNPRINYLATPTLQQIGALNHNNTTITSSQQTIPQTNSTGTTVNLAEDHYLASDKFPATFADCSNLTQQLQQLLKEWLMAQLETMPVSLTQAFAQAKANKEQLQLASSQSNVAKIGTDTIARNDHNKDLNNYLEEWTKVLTTTGIYTQQL